MATLGSRSGCFSGMGRKAINRCTCQGCVGQADKRTPSHDVSCLLEARSGVSTEWSHESQCQFWCSHGKVSSKSAFIFSAFSLKSVSDVSR